jgi:hypothetical protein
VARQRLRWLVVTVVAFFAGVLAERARVTRAAALQHSREQREALEQLLPPLDAYRTRLLTSRVIPADERATFAMDVRRIAENHEVECLIQRLDPDDQVLTIRTAAWWRTARALSSHKPGEFAATVDDALARADELHEAVVDRLHEPNHIKAVYRPRRGL